jgi:palmitoyltransferase
MLARIKQLIFVIVLCLRRTSEAFFRFVGPVLSVGALTLVTGLIGDHFLVVIPYYAPYTSLTGLVHIVTTSFVAVNIYYYYLKSMMTPPGHPPQQHIDPEELERIRNEPQPSKGSGFARYCKVCKVIKSERSHHCHVCRRCVLKMDHHCPWINNCVGHNNHHYFVLFLAHTLFGVFYGAVMAFAPFQQALDFKQVWSAVLPRSAVILSFILEVALVAALGALLGWQIFLLLTGQTTIEFYFNKAMQRDYDNYRNPYDLGTKLNFRHFFHTDSGVHWYSWFVPGGTTVLGDGLHWKTYRDVKPEHAV